jgi:hypothetical protein
MARLTVSTQAHAIDNILNFDIPFLLSKLGLSILYHAVLGYVKYLGKPFGNFKGIF